MSDPFQNESGDTSALRALCALHPETQAVSSCVRCGNFMCHACIGDPGGRCPACAQPTGLHGFPFHRNAWTFSGLWEHTAALFKPQWLLLSLSTLIVLVVSMVGSSVAQAIGMGIAKVAGVGENAGAALLLGFSLFGVIIQAGMSLGLMRICMDVLEGRQVDPMRLFTQFGRLPQFLLAMLLLFAVGFAGALVIAAVGGVLFGISPWVGGLGLLALIPVLLLLCTPMYLLPAALVAEPELDGVAALGKLWRSARPALAPILGVTLVGGLVMLGGLMLCGVGFIPASAFAQLLNLALYLAISRSDPAELAAS